MVMYRLMWLCGVDWDVNVIMLEMKPVVQCCSLFHDSGLDIWSQQQKDIYKTRVYQNAKNFETHEFHFKWNKSV
jgi:hypothetical protein